jgi:hypothetical protein
MPLEVLVIILGAMLTAIAITGVIVFGTVHNTRMKIRNGYPLESMWGRPLHPRSTSEEGERIKLITQENAQLRAELSAVSERLINVERIVTDGGYRLDAEIAALRDERSKVQ